MKTLIQLLAGYMHGLTYEEIPDETLETAKMVILDAYGNLQNSKNSESSKMVIRYAKQLSKDRIESEKIFFLDDSHEAVIQDMAVFAYSVMGRMADMDDGFTKAMGHPGSFLVPILLVLSKKKHTDGKEMLTALTAAYDVYARIGEAINPFMHRDRGFDATGVCGAIAAAGLIARLWETDLDTMENSMGLAASFSGGLIECQNDGTSGKYLCGAWAAANGLQAVRLAMNGFRGSARILEGKSGLFHGFCGHRGYDASAVADRLGTSFKINEIYFKRYACLRGIHATMDAVSELMREYELEEKNIVSVDIRASEFLLRLSRPAPETPVSAQGSLQFGAAVIMKYGHLKTEEFLEKCMNDPEIHRVMKKITVTEDETQKEYLNHHPTHFSASKVVVFTEDGRCLDKFKGLPDGEEGEHRFGWKELEEKFRWLSAKLPTQMQDMYIAQIRKLDQEECCLNFV